MHMSRGAHFARLDKRVSSNVHLINTDPIAHAARYLDVVVDTCQPAQLGFQILMRKLGQAAGGPTAPRQLFATRPPERSLDCAELLFKPPHSVRGGAGELAIVGF